MPTFREVSWNRGCVGVVVKCHGGGQVVSVDSIRVQSRHLHIIPVKGIILEH